MQHVSIPRFVLVHALISGMVSLGFPSLSGASPMPQPLDPPPPWTDQQSNVLTLEDVLLSPVVTETTAAEVLHSIGVAVAPDANVAITAEGDLPSGGQFNVHLGGEPTGDVVRVLARTTTMLSMVQQEIVGEDQEVVADTEATVSLASATLVHDSVGKPVLCAPVKLSIQPREEGADVTVVTGVSILGEAVNALTATAFVRQIADWSAPQAMEQQGGGITPPTPPPPTMQPCCACTCDAISNGSGLVCASIFASCVAGALLLAFINGTGYCAVGCLLLGPLAPACMAACAALSTTSFTLMLAACLGAYTTCKLTAEVAADVCHLACWVTGSP